MKYYESMKSLIGNTPLVKLTHVGVPEGVNLFVKLELWNPSGSVKDRTGYYMVEEAFEMRNWELKDVQWTHSEATVGIGETPTGGRENEEKSPVRFASDGRGHPFPDGCRICGRRR